MLREEDFVAWLHNVNNPKGLNTLKNNMRRKTRIFNVSVLILWFLDARILALNSLTYITCRFVFLLRITFLALQFLKQFSFVFILVEVNWTWTNSPQHQQEYENKRNERWNTLLFENFLSVYTYFFIRNQWKGMVLKVS